MGDISEHFSRWEHKCQCLAKGKQMDQGYCGGLFDTVDIELNRCLEEIRYALIEKLGIKVWISITGGNRCKKHNDDVSESEHSYHILGLAVDFMVFEAKSKRRVDPQIVYDVIESLYPGLYGLIYYFNRIHFDIRKIMYRSPKSL